MCRTKNAPPEWPVVREEKEITKKYDLFEKQRRIGNIFYVLPHVKEYFVYDDAILRIGHHKEKCSLGGMGVIYFGSGIKDETHNFNLDVVKNSLLHQQSVPI